MKKLYLEVGKIVSTRGLDGELKVESWCDSPEVIGKIENLYFDNGEKGIKVKSSRVHKNMILLHIDGVDSIEVAEKIRGKIIYAHRDDIPKENESYFIQDLLGAEVIDADTGIKYGKIKDVFPTGANDVYTVEGINGKLYYVPVVEGIVVRVDVEKEKIFVRPIEGIFDNDD